MLSKALLERLEIPQDRRERFLDRIALRVEGARRGFVPWYYYSGEIAEPLQEIADLATRLERKLSACAQPSKERGQAAHRVALLEQLALKLPRVLLPFLRIGPLRRPSSKDGGVKQADRIAWGIQARLEWGLRTTPGRPALFDNESVDCIDAYRQQIAYLARAARAQADASSSMQSRGLHIGIPNHPGLTEFVMHIAAEVTDAGGHLGVDKRTNAGSLIDLLGELRPHLPEGFIPAEAKPHISSYARCLKWATSESRKLRPEIPS